MQTQETSLKRNKRRWIWLLVLIAPLVLFLIQSWRMRWVTDDGLINIRVIELLLNGHGPVFNVGERVEAGTSALWIYLISFFGLFGLRTEMVSVVCGILLSNLALVFGILASLKLRRIELKLDNIAASACVPIGILTYAAIPVAWDFASSGLETGMSIFWLALMYYALASWINHAEDEPQGRGAKKWWWLTMFIGSFGPLIRPDLSLMSFMAAGILLLGLGKSFERKDWWKALGSAFFLLGTLPVGYQLFRMGYYAALTPNTALAKSAFMPYWSHGWIFFLNFFGTYYAFVPVGFGLVFLARDVYHHRETRLRALILVAPLLLGFLLIYYVMRVGGGGMHGRLILPGFFCLCLPTAAVRLRIVSVGSPKSHKTSIFAYGAIALIVIWSIISASSIRYKRKDQKSMIYNERAFYVRTSQHRNPIYFEDYKKHWFLKMTRPAYEHSLKRCNNDKEKLKNLQCQNLAPELQIHKPQKYGRVPGFHGWVDVKPETVPKNIVSIIMRGAVGMEGLIMTPSSRVVDRHGLVTAIGSRMRVYKRGKPAHEKAYNLLWVVARYAKEKPNESAKLVDARAALQCQPMKELINAITEPMSWDRFWRNVSLAPKLQKLIIDPDPTKARKELCNMKL